MFEDEHFKARGNLARLTEEGLGEVVIPGVVPTLSETPGRISNLGPPLGNATYEVLRELLGISAVSYTHLDVYKRQVQHSTLANSSRQQSTRPLADALGSCAHDPVCPYTCLLYTSRWV